MRLLNATYCVMANPFMPCLVVDEQNAHTEDPELPSPLEKDSEDENRDSEKDEDTKELEAVSCKCFCCFLACSLRGTSKHSLTWPATFHKRLVPENLTCPALHVHCASLPACIVLVADTYCFWAELRK